MCHTLIVVVVPSCLHPRDEDTYLYGAAIDNLRCPSIVVAPFIRLVTVKCPRQAILSGIFRVGTFQLAQRKESTALIREP